MFCALMLFSYAIAEDTTKNYDGVDWKLEGDTLFLDTKDSKKTIPESGPWTPQIKKIKNVIIGDGFTSLSYGITQFENIDTLTLGTGIIEITEYNYWPKQVKKIILQGCIKEFHAPFPAEESSRHPQQSPFCLRSPSPCMT